MLQDVVKARHLGGYRIYVQFEDGAAGEIDLDQLIEFRGVFETLRNPDEVAKVQVHPELGTLHWPSGADLDPDVLYAQVTGERIEVGEASVA